MLDYPSARNLNSEQLKNEYIAIVEKCKSIGANAIIFQVRPAADAFYNSPYEPWSEWLTGKQGRAPDPYFDPLEFMIEETHKRGMEFHAWVNPYRAVATLTHANICPNHITRTKPEWFFDYDINRYFNPGIPEARTYIVSVISDIVRRYDIDGIHFDDYFYPYPVKDENNKMIDIPDYSTFKKYGQGYSDIKDWRRNNVNMLIMETNDSIKSIKPWVKFGVSPAGVWRNKGYDHEGSATLGLASYDWLYADVLLWLKQGWIDYVAPQLYWNIGHPRADFKILVDWWDKYSYNTDLYIGLNVHGIDATRKDPDWGNPNQIPKQIKLARAHKSVKGFILYRYQSLAKNPLGIMDSLKNNYFKNTVYNEPLIADSDSIKIMPDTLQVFDNQYLTNKVLKIDTLPPLPPVNVETYRIGTQITVAWDDAEESYGTDSSNFYIVYVYPANKKPENLNSSNRYKVVFKNYIRFERHRKIMLFGKKYAFVVTAVDTSANESLPSKPVFIKL